MTKQSAASVIRQVVAVIATIFGVLSASVSTLHLPVAVSAILTAAGPVILAIEHYVGDPSTGSTALVSTPTATVTGSVTPRA